MDTAFAPVPLRLRREQFVRLARPAGTAVSCRRGTLWITIDGESDDIELEPGETFSFRADAPALIGVLGRGATATLERRTVPAAGLRAWWQRLAPSLA